MAARWNGGAMEWRRDGMAEGTAIRVGVSVSDLSWWSQLRKTYIFSVCAGHSRLLSLASFFNLEPMLAEINIKSFAKSEEV
jgi:hypothetical protein